MDIPSPLTAIGISVAKESSSCINCNTIRYLEYLFDSFVKGRISQEEATRICIQNIGNCTPIMKLAQILSVPTTPLSEYSGSKSSIKKTRPWSHQEDLRLLAGINRYGLSLWGTVAKFVGNSRTKAQCLQRWSRGLDPRIAKISWSEEEDKMLLESVGRHGVKSWTLISKEVPSRSDVQCRYRYNQIISGHKVKRVRKSPNYSYISEPTQFIMPVAEVPKERILLPPIFSLVI